MLRALVARDGGVVEAQLRLGDDPAKIRDALRAPGADVILVSGGSSVGSEDHAPRLVAEVGRARDPRRRDAAVEPGGRRPHRRRAGVSAARQSGVVPVRLRFFRGARDPAARRPPADWPHRTRHGDVARKIVSAIGRVDYCRVRLVDDEVEPLALSGASILSSTTRADGFVIVPGGKRRATAPAAEVTVYLYE